jgi:hypothetical protein
MNDAIDQAYDAALQPITKVQGDADFGKSLGQLKTAAQRNPEYGRVSSLCGKKRLTIPRRQDDHRPAG